MSFSIDTVDKLIQVNPGAQLYNLNHTDLISLQGNPLATAGDNKVIQAVGILTNSDLPEYKFYIENMSDRIGWNVSDCEDTREVRYTLPSAPMRVPLQTKPLEIVTPLPGYITKADAIRKDRATDQLDSGMYKLYKEEDGYQYIGDNGYGSMKYWIVAADNRLPDPEPEPVKAVYSNPNWVKPREQMPIASVIEVTPEPVATDEIDVPPPEQLNAWKNTYKPFPVPQEYVVNKEGRVWNLDEYGEDVSVMLRQNAHINAYGTVERDGMLHYRLKVRRDVNFAWWLCAPQTFNGQAVLVLPGPSLADRIFHRRQQLKSIFTSAEPKFLDSIVNPYSKNKKG